MWTQINRCREGEGGGGGLRVGTPLISVSYTAGAHSCSQKNCRQDLAILLNKFRTGVATCFKFPSDIIGKCSWRHHREKTGGRGDTEDE